MKKGIFIYTGFILILLVITYRLIDICLLRHEEFKESYDNQNRIIVSFLSAERGRILDRNGKVLVDNEGVNTVIYNRTEASKSNNEVDIALSLAEVLDFDESKITTSKLKTFYLKLHEDGENLITEEEYELYEKRKLTKSDLDALKFERITEEMLESLSNKERLASYIYSLLTNGYYYEDKIIKTEIMDDEVVKINDLDLPGIRVSLTWKRTYPYGDMLKSIFGSISTNGVPLEEKSHYEEMGVSMNSTVGISYLEYQYDEYLRGTDATYMLNSKGELELVSEAKRGNDLYLSIDIDLTLTIEEILKSEMLEAKKRGGTTYYNHSYIIVGHPKTGEVLAAVGLQLNKDHFVDITANVIHSSYTVGSIVKGATISVGYANDLIKMGEKVTDSCIKVYGVQEKCSWTRLGVIDDIRALAQSSNYYQFLIATRLTNPEYTWNAKLNATDAHFDIYRNMLKSYGLGSITGIDLPGENTGIIGSRVSDDLLLNLAIGQYDTYTPIEVFQYVNTLANGGVKLRPTLMKRIVNGEDTVFESSPTMLGQVSLKEEKLARVQEGLREVMVSGTGRNYTDHRVTSAGKTGTSETFIDTNGDGKMDTKTISTAFIMYAPFESPEYSLVIMSPNISTGSGSTYSINMRLSRRITDYLFS